LLLPRVIPVLLLHRSGLVKSIRFKDYRYVGDPINAVRIFNEKEVDEICVLDIDASKHGKEPNYDYIEGLATETFTPFSYGGGIRTAEQARRLFRLGAEKVVLNTIFLEKPEIIREIADLAGNSSTVVSLDVKKNLFGKYRIYAHKTGKTTDLEPLAAAHRAISLGAGEIFINSVDLDGSMAGYDLKLIHSIATQVDVPVVACGGAGNVQHLKEGLAEGNASAVAAGSMFVFHGKHKAVLINYPSRPEMERIFAKYDKETSY